MIRRHVKGDVSEVEEVGGGSPNRGDAMLKADPEIDVTSENADNARWKKKYRRRRDREMQMRRDAREAR